MNISEGRRPETIAALVEAAGEDLLDIHTDSHHNRSVLTLVGEEAARAVTSTALEAIDLRKHDGVHPRLGAVDVVPFVAQSGDNLGPAVSARDRFVTWMGTELAVPAFAYGPGLASLPEIRRSAFAGLAPTAGPLQPHPRAGATAVGARPALVAYNLWLSEADLALAHSIARSLRCPALRALGLAVGDAVQVSCNLLGPHVFGPQAVYDAVLAHARIDRAELVGLVPQAVLEAADRHRWDELDLSPGQTVESRLRAAGRHVGTPAEGQRRSG